LHSKLDPVSEELKVKLGLTVLPMLPFPGPEVMMVAAVPTLRATVAESPRATQRVCVVHDTAPKRFRVPEDSFAQFKPPSVVVTMAPSSPTAKHVEASAQLMPYRGFDVPEDWLDHAEPPLVVTRTIPESPTAKQVDVVGHEMPLIPSEVPEF
jgi:hypothetical protein